MFSPSNNGSITDSRGLPPANRRSEIKTVHLPRHTSSRQQRDQRFSLWSLSFAAGNKDSNGGNVCSHNSYMVRSDACWMFLCSSSSAYSRYMIECVSVLPLTELDILNIILWQKQALFTWTAHAPKQGDQKYQTGSCTQLQSRPTACRPDYPMRFW